MVAASSKDLTWKEVVATTETIVVDLQNVKLQSIPTARPDPVKIVDGKIRIDEYQMEDGVPYAFQYQDEYYLLARIDGKLTLYGLR